MCFLHERFKVIQDHVLGPFNRAGRDKFRVVE